MRKDTIMKKVKKTGVYGYVSPDKPDEGINSESPF